METTTISTVSLITQGKHKFYSFTMESDILVKVCFVISRDEDPTTGFQRNLDERRARECASANVLSPVRSTNKGMNTPGALSILR